MQEISTRISVRRNVNYTYPCFNHRQKATKAIAPKGGEVQPQKKIVRR